jgi:uncharacterized protein
LESQAELFDYIASDSRLARLLSEVSLSLTNEPEHDLSHALRVALWTVRIGASKVSVRDAIAAALCHDLVVSPKNSPRKKEDASESARAAQRLLSRCGFAQKSLRAIMSAIKSHSYSRGVKPKAALGRALQDADRLEALGAIGIMRALSIGGTLRRRLICSEDPWASRRELDDNAYTLDHFFTKLLRIGNTMCTPLGQREAYRRTRVLEVFLKDLAVELEAESPPIDALIARSAQGVKTEMSTHD